MAASSCQFNTGHFEADGGAIYLPIGHVPDYFMLMDFHTDTNIVFYHWWRQMELDMGTGKQEGVSVAEGVTANLADDGGITAYDSSDNYPSVSTWTEAVATAATARTATASGTFVKPSTTGTMDTGEAADRSLIFECVTAGTGGSTEPTWPTEAGGQVTDNSVVWERVTEPLFRSGYQGVSIAAALMTNGQEYFYNAWLANKARDHGDVDGWTSGVWTP